MMSHCNYLFVLSLSPFPLLSSLSFFNVIMGFFFIMKFDFLVFFLGLVSALISGLSWWVFYCMESCEKGEFSFNLEFGLKYSFILFIFSEIFFFFSFFWSYFHFFLSSLMELNFSWPPYSVFMFYFLDIPLLNTFLLLTSGVSVTISHLFLIKGENFYSSFYLFFTYFLGLIFSYFQYLEYSNSFFSFNDSCFGSCFYILTGFHGIHVIIGSIYLMFVFFRQYGYLFFNSSCFLSFELASWYWHFVDVVWIFLYFFIYVYSCS